MAKPNRDRLRVRQAPTLALCGFGIVALSQLRVQVLQRDHIIDQGKKTDRFVVERIDRARRGPIVSADGKPLAAMEDSSELVIDFRKVPNSPAFFMDLGSACGVPASELQQLKSAGIKSRTWQERLSPEQTRRVQEVKTDWRADGISTSRLGRRIYPLAEAAACLLGYLRDDKPQNGLEYALNDRLSGEDGRTVGMVDRSGDFLPLRMDPDSRVRRDGERVELTIDSELQIAAAAAVKQAVETNKAEQGCAIIIEPSTGNVLAMANWPSFDPERMGEPRRPEERFSDFNSATMARLEPGSTFKILTLALALDEKAIQFNTQINCQGAWRVWPTTDVHCDAHAGKRAHGLIGPIEAISRSCNVSAAHWAVDIGYESFTAFLKESGLMDKPNLGLPGEIPGSYKRDEYAKRLQLATFGFGQSLTVTPMAVCSAFSMLGNGGVRMKPRLIAKIGGHQTPVQEAGRLVSKETADQVMEAMENVFSSEHGTGRTLRIPGYRLAGKTGTAEKRNKGEQGYVSNFIGFVPAENPRAAILVMIDHPKMGKYYGASVAGPVFTNIAHAAIRRLGIERSRPRIAPPARPQVAADDNETHGPQVNIRAQTPGPATIIKNRENRRP